jgi:hypothetical protein
MRYWPWPGGWGHGTTVCVVLSAAEREQLAAIVADCNRLRKRVERAPHRAASADRHSEQQVAQSIGVSRLTVWRWQQRFAESGIEGLLRDNDGIEKAHEFDVAVALCNRASWFGSARA